MAIRDVVTMGFGNGTYSPGVAKLPTFGYSIGEATIQILSGCWAQGEVYNLGYQTGQTYRPGFKAGEINKPGFKEGQEVC